MIWLTDLPVSLLGMYITHASRKDNFPPTGKPAPSPNLQQWLPTREDSLRLQLHGRTRRLTVFHREELTGLQKADKSQTKSSNASRGLLCAGGTRVDGRVGRGRAAATHSAAGHRASGVAASAVARHGHVARGSGAGVRRHVGGAGHGGGRVAVPVGKRVSVFSSVGWRLQDAFGEGGRVLTRSRSCFVPARLQRLGWPVRSPWCTCC